MWPANALLPGIELSSVLGQQNCVCLTVPRASLIQGSSWVLRTSPSPRLPAWVHTGMESWAAPPTGLAHYRAVLQDHNSTLAGWELFTAQGCPASGCSASKSEGSQYPYLPKGQKCFSLAKKPTAWCTAHTPGAPRSPPAHAPTSLPGPRSSTLLIPPAIPCGMGPRGAAPWLPLNARSEKTSQELRSRGAGTGQGQRDEAQLAVEAQLPVVCSTDLAKHSP